MFGEQRSDWLKDGREGHEVFVKKAASLHQVQASGQTRQPAEREANGDETTFQKLSFYLVDASFRHYRN